MKKENKQQMKTRVAELNDPQLHLLVEIMKHDLHRVVLAFSFLAKNYTVLKLLPLVFFTYIFLPQDASPPKLYVLLRIPVIVTSHSEMILLAPRVVNLK